MRFLKLLIIFILSFRLFSKDLFVSAIEYPPYTSSNLEGFGLSFEILTEALKNTEYNIIPVFLPLGRAYTKIRNEEYSVNLYNTPAIFDLRIYERVDTIAVLYTFYYNKDFNNVFWNDLKDLKGLRLGSIRVINREGIRDELKDAGIVTDETDSLVQIFTMLKKGRIDIALSVDLTAKYLIDQLFPEDRSIVQTEKKYMIIKGGPWFNISSQLGTEAMNEYIIGKKRMLKDGSLIRIMEKYYGKGKVPPEAIIQDNENGF